jgi:hypothetical protein
MIATCGRTTINRTNRQPRLDSHEARRAGKPGAAGQLPDAKLPGRGGQIAGPRNIFKKLSKFRHNWPP